MSSRDVVEAVEKASDGKFGFRCGAFYSVRLSEEVLGLDKGGVVRVSMVHYNTGKPVFHFAFDKILSSITWNTSLRVQNEVFLCER